VERYINNIQNTVGDAISGVTVTVRLAVDSSLASIFSDNLLPPTVKANPFTNDADGEFSFFAGNDLYDIIFTGPITETVADVTLFDETDTPLRGPTFETTVVGPTLMSLGERHLVDVTANAVTLTLPLDPGATIEFPAIIVQHVKGAIGTNNITVARNGELIGGSAADFVMTNTDQGTRFIWAGSTLGWAVQTGLGLAFSGVLVGTLLEVDNSANATEAAIRARNSEGGFRIRADGDVVTFDLTDSDGVTGPETAWTVTGDGGMEVMFNGVGRWKTVDVALTDISAGAQVHDGTAYRSVGKNIMPFNAQVGTTYTVDKDDSGYGVSMDNVAANTVTLPNDTNIEVGAMINIVQKGAGVTSVATAAAVTMKFADGTSGTAKTVVITNRFGWVSCIKEADAVWYVTGGAT